MTIENPTEPGMMFGLEQDGAFDSIDMGLQCLRKEVEGTLQSGPRTEELPTDLGRNQERMAKIKIGKNVFVRLSCLAVGCGAACGITNIEGRATAEPLLTPEGVRSLDDCILE